MTDQQPQRTRDADDMIFGGGSKSASFGDRDTGPGAFVEGIVLEKRVATDTNYTTGKPETWDDGSPKQHPVITLQTSLREGPDDNGIRDLHVKVSKQPGGMSRVIGEAAKAAQPGVTKPVVEIGSWLRVDYTHKVGDARGYAAQYRTAADVALDPSIAAAYTAPDVSTVKATPPAAAAAGAGAGAAGAAAGGVEAAAAVPGMPSADQVGRLAALNPAYAGLPLATLETLRAAVPGMAEALDGPPPAAAAPATAPGTLAPAQIAALAALEGGAALVGLPLATLQAVAGARPDVAAALAAA